MAQPPRRLPISRAPAARPPDVVIGGRVFVRRGLLPTRTVQSRYMLDLFKESLCGRCKNREFRPNDLCDPCEGYQGRHTFNRTLQHRNGTVYDSLPLADLPWLREQVRNHPEYSNLKFENRVRKIPMNWPLRFTGSLYGPDDRDDRGNQRTDQQRLVREWLEKRGGVIQARPRSGKTVMCCNIVCHEGVKTVIFAHKYKLLKQFYDTFMGTPKHPNPDKRRPAFTNAPVIEQQVGAGRSVFLVTKTAQLMKFGDNPREWPDVLLINYQKFPHKLGRVAQWINRNYSHLWVDEVHQGAADAYARTLMACEQPLRGGLSATPERKDELDRKTLFTIGPVVTVANTVTLPVRVETHSVAAIPDTDYSHWAFALRWCGQSEARNKEIVGEVFKDFMRGHRAIIVPVHSLDHQRTLIEMINHRIRHLRQRDPRWRRFPYPLAVAFNGGVDQDAVIDRVDDGRPCVLVAIQSMIRDGVDMSVPSMAYLTIPMSATVKVGSPGFEQFANRVATSSARKPRPPTVKIFIDNISAFRGALNALWWSHIVPGSKADATDNGPSYILNDDTFRVMGALKNKQKRGGRGKGRRGISGGGGSWGG